MIGKRLDTLPAKFAQSKCAALRREMFSPNLSFLMEAHNGLSAKIVAEAGFAGLWAAVWLPAQL